MAVKYKLIERANPSKREEKKLYATAVSTGEVTLKALSKEIAQGSTTVSDTDVMAVLNDLTKMLNRHLSDGKIVRFGDFGSFQIAVSSNGIEIADEKKFHPSQINTKKITFRPGVDLKETLNNLKFEKA